MKILASILSFYILFLTAVPCIDKEDCHSSIKTEQTQDINHQHETGMNHCSPFCTCQCCTSPSVLHDNITQFEYFSYTQKFFSIYTSDYNSSLYAAIWQPPKIS